MRFKTIGDFYNKGKVCPLCKNKTYLFFNTRDGGGFIDCEFRSPPSIAKFLGRKDMVTVEYALKARKYVSNVDGNNIKYHYNGNPDLLVDLLKNSGFSINMEDNSLDGDLNTACNLIWRHNLSLCVRCTNEWCFGSGFLFTYNSKPLIIERRNKILSPLILESQILGIPSNDIEANTSISLMTLNNEEETFLIDKYKVIAKIPKIDLFSIKNSEELRKKIKTFLLFS